MIELGTMKRLFIFLPIVFLEIFLAYELAYKDKVYPGILVEGKDFGNWKKEEVENFFALKNKKFYQTRFVFSFKEKVATVSGEELNWGYNPKKIAKNTFEIGRSRRFSSDFRTKLEAFFRGVTLEPSYNFNEKKLREILLDFEEEAYLPPENPLFQFRDGRVIAFQKEKEGQELDIEKAILKIKRNLTQSPNFFKIELTTRPIKPEITIDRSNNLGLRELLGTGISYFWGSSSSRIHNIVLASNR